MIGTSKGVMAGRFSWLDRSEGESVAAYDKRINELEAFHSGYAFLSYENYCPEFAAFAVYTVWNDEFNKKLTDPVPEGGFMIHCDEKRAYEMCTSGHGFPVFVKLLSRLGRLYVESYVMADKEVLFDLYFNGCEVKKPEGLVFMETELPKSVSLLRTEDDTLRRQSTGSCGRSSYISGSFLRGSFLRGSYIKGSFIKGSYLRSSYLRGSYSKGSFLAGFYTSGLSGSYLTWFFGGSSYLKQLFGAGSYRNVIFSGGSFRAGSFIRGSYMSGSYTGRYFLTGSFYSGSYHSGSFIYGGFSDVMTVSYKPGKDGEAAWEHEPNRNRQEGAVVRRLIEELGYGLDLI